MKKILLVALVFLTVFLIYLATMDRKVYYLVLGNSRDNSSLYIKKYLKKKGVLEKYVYDFERTDVRITDIINDINSNKKVNDITIKNALIKADLVTLSIDGFDVYSRIKDNEVYDYIDDLTNDLDDLFKLMRQYCKEDIVLFGIYNPFIDLNDSNINDVIDYFNKKYKNVCLKYNIIYIDLSDMKEPIYKLIGQKSISIISKNLFEG